MKSCFKPGDIVWCTEGGDVKQVEVTTFQRDDLTATLVKLPNDDVICPWRCWDGFLFKKRKEALKAACKQLKESIKDEKEDIQDIRDDIKRQQAQLQVLQGELKQLQQEAT